MGVIKVLDLVGVFVKSYIEEVCAANLPYPSLTLFSSGSLGLERKFWMGIGSTGRSPVTSESPFLCLSSTNRNVSDADSLIFPHSDARSSVNDGILMFRELLSTLLSTWRDFFRRSGVLIPFMTI